MFEQLKRILSEVKTDYADLRYELKAETKIAYDARELSLVTSNTTDGYVLRVLNGGGLATVAFTRAGDAGPAIRTALENAALIGQRVEAPVRFAEVER